MIEYGSALYWALLFFGIYIITIFAEQRTSTLRPNIWAGLLMFLIWGFTTWSPNKTTLLLGVVAYLIIGAAMATVKWIDLVSAVKTFTSAIETVEPDHYKVRCMAQKKFMPNDALDECMVIPPDPFEFRTRIWLWFMYWPSFTFLRPLTEIHKVVARSTWKTLCTLSREVYDSRDYK